MWLFLVQGDKIIVNHYLLIILFSRLLTLSERRWNSQRVRSLAQVGKSCKDYRHFFLCIPQFKFTFYPGRKVKGPSTVSITPNQIHQCCLPQSGSSWGIINYSATWYPKTAITQLVHGSMLGSLGCFFCSSWMGSLSHLQEVLLDR